MTHSIQWPKAGDVLGDFILESPREVTAVRARYSALHEPTNKKALITCGTSPLDSNRFLKKATELFLCQVSGAAKIADAKYADDFYWIASEYIDCVPMPAALRRKMADRNPNDIETRFRLAMVFGLGIGQTLVRFEKAGIVHGELDPFRTALGLQGDRFGSLIFETGFNDLMDYDFDRARAHPLFYAPEQLHGHPPSIQTDLYACAMIMRVLMLGSPFSSDRDQLLRQCQEERPAPLKQSWPNLRRISDLMDAALEKDPANRPRNWEQFLGELLVFLGEAGLLAPDDDEEEQSDTQDEALSAREDVEPERSSVPAKSKVKVQELPSEPRTTERERLVRAPKIARAGAPLSLVGRARKTQTAYFQAPAECGPFQIVGVLHGLGELQRYQALEKQSQEEARLVCMRASDVSGEQLAQWAIKRAGVKSRFLPALLACGVDDGFCFVGEEMSEGAPIGDVLAFYAAQPKPWHLVCVAAITALVGVVMQRCMESGLLHGNLNPDVHIRFRVHEGYAGFDFIIHEVGVVEALNAHETALKNPFAAPEVRAGKAWDHRADMYSLAAYLHEHLTGCPAFPLEDGFENVFTGLPLADVMIRALSADPDKRFATWNEFKEAVNETVPPSVWKMSDAWQAPGSAASSSVAEPVRSSSDEPSAPSTLRSEGVKKKERAAETARSRSTTLMRWTPSPIVIYERSPMMVFTRSPAAVYQRSPLAVYGGRRVLMKLKRVANPKRLGTALAALAVAAVVLLVIGALSSRPRASVLAAHPIEMVVPVLAKAEAMPAMKIERGNAEEKAKEPRAKDAPRTPIVARKATPSKTNSTDSRPKQSLEHGHFIFGNNAGADPGDDG